MEFYCHIQKVQNHLRGLVREEILQNIFHRRNVVSLSLFFDDFHRKFSHVLYSSVRLAHFFTTRRRHVSSTEPNFTHFPRISNVSNKFFQESLFCGTNSCVDITILVSSNHCSIVYLSSLSS